MAPHAASSPERDELFSESHLSTKCTLLRVSGTEIVDADNKPVVLKGAGLGGFLNMENFITGYSGHECEFRESMSVVLGPRKAQFFFDRFLHHFFTEADAEFFASLGLNCIRVPFNYRHFIDDEKPHEIKESGFALLDRVVNICRKYNLYVILDLHAAPGGQNQDWHSDSSLARALFWDFELFQEQTINLWIAIAKHYAGDTIIAGYNPLNEPADPRHVRLLAWYDRVEKAIRSVDPDHILFIDGNTYAMDFSRFDRILPNAVYSCHDYSTMGFPIAGQAPYSGTAEQKLKLRQQFDRKAQFMRDWGVPIWNGEFGPVYPNAHEPDAKAINASRLEMLKEQLHIYDESKVSWSIWLYKDIGYQGMVYVSEDTPYMKLVSPFIKKKQRLGLDFWGCTDKEAVEGVYGPFIRGLKDMVAIHLHGKKYPPTWTFDRQVERVVRECLMSEYVVWEFAELFQDKTEEELEELARSFRFEYCIKREGLNALLQEDAAIQSK